MNKANKEIRIAMLRKGLTQIELAKILGISNCTLSTWLRTELPKDRKEILMEVIKRGSM